MITSRQCGKREERDFSRFHDNHGADVSATTPSSSNRPRRGLSLCEVLVVLCIIAILVGLFLPAVRKVRGPAGRTHSSNNLKQMTIALHAYADDHSGRLPPPAILDQEGKPLLSWRVLILPYVEQQDLYERFHLDEPWDSEHNIKLLKEIPEVYSPVKGAHWTDNAPPAGTTFYQVIVGPGAAFEHKPVGISLSRDIMDGTSNTILIVSASKSVPWTKPEDLSYAPGGPLPELMRLEYESGGWFTSPKLCYEIGWADGSVVRCDPAHFTESELRSAILRNDGRTFDPFE